MQCYKDVFVGEWNSSYTLDLLYKIRENDRIDLQMIAEQEKISWQEVFFNTITQSTQIYSLLINYVCHGAFGVRAYPLYPHSAFIWFLCSDALFLRKRAILTLAIDKIEHFHKDYPLLLNYISEKNIKTTTPFLKYCGFTIGEAYKYKGSKIHVFFKFFKKSIQ